MKFRYFLSHKALFLATLMLLGVTPKTHSFSFFSFFGVADQKTTTKPAVSRPVATRPMVTTVASSKNNSSFSVVKTLKKYCARTRKAMTAFFSAVFAELTKENYAQSAATATVATVRHVNRAPAVAQPAARAGAAPRIKTYAERVAELKAQKEARERAVQQRIEQLRQAEEERKRIEAARIQELRAERLRQEQVAQARATIARQQQEQAARSRAAANAPAPTPSCSMCAEEDITLYAWPCGNAHPDDARACRGCMTRWLQESAHNGGGRRCGFCAEPCHHEPNFD